MLLQMPGTGGTIDASPEHAEVLVAAGWTPVEPEGDKKKVPATRRRSSRKTKEKSN